MKDLFMILARYNQWSNQRIYQACARLDTEAYYLNRQAFFESIHGTLNHGLLADRIWLGRFDYTPYVFSSLRDQLYSQLVDLTEARQQEDGRIIAFIQSQSEADLLQTFTYTNTQGETLTQPLWQCLTHYFNHQTHHRGQVHQMLSEVGQDPPSLDLVAMLREENASAS